MDLLGRAAMAALDWAGARAHRPKRARDGPALGRRRGRGGRGRWPDHRSHRTGQAAGRGRVAEHGRRPDLEAGDASGQPRLDRGAGRAGGKRDRVRRGPSRPCRWAPRRGDLPVRPGCHLAVRGQADPGQANLPPGHHGVRKQSRVRRRGIRARVRGGVLQRARPRLASDHRWRGHRGSRPDRRARRYRGGGRERPAGNRGGGPPPAPDPDQPRRAPAGGPGGPGRERHPRHDGQRPGRGRPHAGRGRARRAGLRPCGWARAASGHPRACCYRRRGGAAHW